MEGRAGKVQAALIGELRVERMALNAGPLGHHAEGREPRADAAVADGQLANLPGRRGSAGP
jgi:hypothetical protein